MAQPKKWLWGLLPLSVLALLLFFNKTTPIETELTDRISQSLAAEGLDFAEISLSGRDATITGLAPLEEAKARAEELAEKSFGVRVAKSNITVLPLQAPYTTSYTLEGDTLTLSGYVPNEAARAALLEKAEANFAGKTIKDALQLARGSAAENVFFGSADYGLAQLTQLDSGVATLTDESLSVSGSAKDWPSYSSVKAGLANVADGVTLGSSDITAPPVSSYIMNGSLTDTSLTLSGFVPDEAAKTSLLDAAKLNFVGVEIIDKLSVQEGAPNQFLEAANTGLQVLSRLRAGSISLAGTDLNVDGTSFTTSINEAVKKQVTASLPQGFAGTATLTEPEKSEPVDTGTCSTFIRGFLDKGEIRFASGKADINATSNALLDRISYIAGRCPQATIEVSGHTDSDGADDANLALSQARAEAVRAYLVSIGVEEARLNAVGYGETQPVATNETAEGKAQNRRIEFKLSE